MFINVPITETTHHKNTNNKGRQTGHTRNRHVQNKRHKT